MSEPVIELRSVSKCFGKVEALNSVNWQISEGEVIGLVGPNGAGKTTMFRLICTLLAPSKGRMLFYGKDYRNCLDKIREKIGYLKEITSLYHKLTVLDNIRIFAKGRGITLSNAQLQEITVNWKLQDFCEQRVKTLSKGQRQKVNLLCSIMHDPDIVILDEPFSGLDLENKEFIRQKIFQLKSQRKTILISSHNIDEVEKTADNLVLLHKGNLLLKDSTEQVKKSILGTVFRIVLSHLPENKEALSAVTGEIEFDIKNHSMLVKLKNEEEINKLLLLLIAENCVIHSLNKLSLEEHLLYLFVKKEVPNMR